MQRLDKVLSDAGVATRKEIRNLVRSGQVMIDGVFASSPDQKIDDNAELLVHGNR